MALILQIMWGGTTGGRRRAALAVFWEIECNVLSCPPNGATPMGGVTDCMPRFPGGNPGEVRAAGVRPAVQRAIFQSF